MTGPRPRGAAAPGRPGRAAAGGGHRRRGSPATRSRSGSTPSPRRSTTAPPSSCPRRARCTGSRSPRPRGSGWTPGSPTVRSSGPHYDPMLAKVIAHGATRADAARRLARALRTARIHGVVTNRDLLVAILGEAEFLAGHTDTGYLTRHPEVVRGDRGRATVSAHRRRQPRRWPSRRATGRRRRCWARCRRGGATSWERPSASRTPTATTPSRSPTGSPATGCGSTSTASRWTSTCSPLRPTRWTSRSAGSAGPSPCTGSQACPTWTVPPARWRSNGCRASPTPTPRSRRARCSPRCRAASSACWSRRAPPSPPGSRSWCWRR